MEIPTLRRCVLPSKVLERGDEVLLATNLLALTRRERSLAKAQSSRDPGANQDAADADDRGDHFVGHDGTIVSANRVPCQSGPEQATAYSMRLDTRASCAAALGGAAP
jgi:hypothetical protein